MKKLFIIMFCILLVSCTSREELEQQHAKELAVRDEEIKKIDSLQDKVLDLENQLRDKESIIESLQSNALTFTENYEAQKKAYSYFETVNETAHHVIEALLYLDKIEYPDYNYTDYRLDDLVFSAYNKELDVSLFMMNYSYKSLTPENIVFAGPIEALDKDFILPTCKDSHYLVFRDQVFLGHFYINDARPGTEAFKTYLDDFVAKQALDKERLDFIGGDLLYSIQLLHDPSVIFDRLSSKCYKIGGSCEGYIKAIYEEDFDLHNLVYKTVVSEEYFDTNNMTIQVITQEVTSKLNGIYYDYLAYIRVSDQEGYVINSTKFDQEVMSKVDFITMLKSIQTLELSSYEKVELENTVISSNEGLDIVLKKGYFTNDKELWNASGPKWYGDFEFQVRMGSDIVVSPLDYILFFYAPEFNLSFFDYNNDGLTDFALSQYAATNINDYMLYTIKEDGHIVPLAIENNVLLGPSTRDNSPLLDVHDNHIVLKFYDNTNVVYNTDYYQWNGEKYIRIKREVTDD